MARRRTRFRPRWETLDDRCLPALTGMTPAQLIPAYGLNLIPYTSGNKDSLPGLGQKIALIEAYHDPYLMNDLAGFVQAYGLVAADVQQVNLSGSPTNVNAAW